MKAVDPIQQGSTQVDSTSSDPHLGGPIEVCATAARLFIRWAGEQHWLEIEWHEIMWLFQDARPDYKKVLGELRESAFEEGFKAGLEAQKLEHIKLEEAAVKKGVLIIGRYKKTVTKIIPERDPTPAA